MKDGYALFQERARQIDELAGSAPLINDSRRMIGQSPLVA